MNKCIFLMGVITSVLALNACTPIQIPVHYQYKLASFDEHRYAPRLHQTILISQPEAMTGYQTEQMLYIKQPFQLESFAEHAWVGAPANMLYPLLIQSLQSSHAFKAIASSPFADKVDYRLDTQIISMQQNFITKPSQFELTLKMVVTRVENNQVLSSYILSSHISCPTDTPYGGVLAGNKALVDITRRITQHVIHDIEQDHITHIK